MPYRPPVPSLHSDRLAGHAPCNTSQRMISTQAKPRRSPPSPPTRVRPLAVTLVTNQLHQHPDVVLYFARYTLQHHEWPAAATDPYFLRPLSSSSTHRYWPILAFVETFDCPPATQASGPNGTRPRSSAAASRNSGRRTIDSRLHYAPCVSHKHPPP